MSLFGSPAIAKANVSASGSPKRIATRAEVSMTICRLADFRADWRAIRIRPGCTLTAAVYFILCLTLLLTMMYNIARIDSEARGRKSVLNSACICR